MAKIYLAILVITGLTWFILMQGTVAIAEHEDRRYNNILELGG